MYGCYPSFQTICSILFISTFNCDYIKSWKLKWSISDCSIQFLCSCSWTNDSKACNFSWLRGHWGVSTGKSDFHWIGIDDGLINSMPPNPLRKGTLLHVIILEGYTLIADVLRVKFLEIYLKNFCFVREWDRSSIDWCLLWVAAVAGVGPGHTQAGSLFSCIIAYKGPSSWTLFCFFAGNCSEVEQPSDKLASVWDAVFAGWGLTCGRHSVDPKTEA